MSMSLSTRFFSVLLGMASLALLTTVALSATQSAAKPSTPAKASVDKQAPA